MKKYNTLVTVVLVFVAAMFLSACTHVTPSEEVMQDAQHKYVVVFGETKFVRNATKTLQDLGVIVDHADNYALALSNTAHDDQVELHCINKANGQQVVMQASHSTDLYPAVICSNGIIFRNFITPGLLPDGFFD